METTAPSPPDYSALANQVPAGFWQRFFAFLINLLVVSIPCFTLAEVFHSFFLGSPLTGSLLGSAITVGYFAILGSDFVDGQTLGMMALGLKVVKRDGSKPTFALSLARYSIFFVPFS